MRFTRASLNTIIRSFAFWIFTASQRFAGMSRMITLTPARQAYDTCAPTPQCRTRLRVMSCSAQISSRVPIVSLTVTFNGKHTPAST